MAIQPLPRLPFSDGDPLDYQRPASPDNYLAHLAPFSVGAIFFGNFCPQHRDSPATRQAMFKTSFAYIHFLSPAGLRVSMIDREAVFTGTVANGMTVRLASELARALDGVANVVNDTSLAEDATAESELRALYTFAIGSDALLADEPLTLEVRGDRVKVHGEVGSEEARDWAQRFLPAIANGAKVEVALTVATRDGEAKPLPRVDGDSLQALVLTRLGLLGENAIARPRFKSRRQRVNCAAQVSDKALGELAEAIVAHTFGVREAKCQIEVPTA